MSDADRNGDNPFSDMADGGEDDVVQDQTAPQNGDEWREIDADTDDRPERPTTQESTLGRLGAKMIATIPKPLLGVRGTLFKRLAVKSIENYHKTAGGDAIAFNAKANQQIDLEPVLYRAPEECDEGEKPGWKVAGRDKVWNPSKQGDSVDYLGRTPMVNLEDDDHVAAGWLAPRIGHAIEMDQYSPVFTNPTFKSVFEVGGQQTADAGALADGGQTPLPQQQLDRWAQQNLGGLELDRPGRFTGETLIDLDSGDGYDGMRISASKAREWRAENADSEQMQMQEDRGYLRGLAQGDEGPGTFKLLLLCGAIILGALGIIEMLPILLSSGGGGGGINPLMINALGSALPL